jgi:manganese-dependent inorganic pyrophosphatase
MPSSDITLPFYVIGHKNPDTDAICSAIGYASFLRLNGDSHVTPARCGELTLRTAWVLEQAKMPVPVLVEDVRTTAEMMCRRNELIVSPEDTFLVAYRKMLQGGVRAVPVVDNDGIVLGVLRYLDLLELLLPPETEGLSVRIVHASLSKIADTLEAAISGFSMINPDQENDLVVLVGASSKKTVESRLDDAKRDGFISQMLMICGDRPHVHKLAIEAGARAILITGNNRIDDELEELAKKNGVVILLSSLDTASCATLIRCSRTVKNVINSSFESVCAKQPVSVLRKKLATISQELFPVIDPETKKMLGVVSKFDLIDPPRLRLALVDHNEFAQAVNGVEEADVVQVIDHHRLAGDIVTRDPIRYLNEPVGSTSTLVARKFLFRDLKPEPGIALCLLAGIVSDTLNLTSPTTTDLDREILTWLAGIAGVDAGEFTKDLFAIGSLLATASTHEILNADRKAFTDDGVKISIAQVEELGLDALEPRKGELIAALQKVLEDEKLDLICLVVTDISKHFSRILVAGHESLINALPYERSSIDSLNAPGVVSRKKQVFPAVCEAIRVAKR